MNRFRSFILTATLASTIGCGSYSKDYCEYSLDLDGNNIPETTVHLREHIVRGELQYSLVSPDTRRVLVSLGSDKPLNPRFSDVNHDGLVDFCYEDGFSFCSQTRMVALNKGNGTFNSPTPL